MSVPEIGSVLIYPIRTKVFLKPGWRGGFRWAHWPSPGHSSQDLNCSSFKPSFPFFQFSKPTVTGSLRKFIQKPQNPILAPPPATQAGGWAQLVCPLDRESLSGAKKWAVEVLLTPPWDCPLIPAPGRYEGYGSLGGACASSGCNFYGSSLPFIRK